MHAIISKVFIVLDVRDGTESKYPSIVFLSIVTKNIVNTPSCTCGDSESALYLFFIFPIYRHTRDIYFSDILHDTHGLLYGKEIAADLEHEAIFLKVQYFLS